MQSKERQNNAKHFRDPYVIGSELLTHYKKVPQVLVKQGNPNRRTQNCFTDTFTNKEILCNDIHFRILQTSVRGNYIFSNVQEFNRCTWSMLPVVVEFELLICFCYFGRAVLVRLCSLLCVSVSPYDLCSWITFF